MHDDLTPRERLARIVAEETGDGRRIVTFLVQVAEGELNSEGFQPCHRMDSAKELVKIGLTEFSDYVRANSTPRKTRASRTSAPDTDISPEIAQAREQLAEYARELTQDGRTVIKMYAEVMEGIREDEGFKPHHRIAAARELIKRGFDETYTCATPEVCPEPDSTVIPVTAGTHTSELITDDSEWESDEERQAYLNSPENMAKLFEIVKWHADQVTPEEREAHEAAWRGKDLSMWEKIRKQPHPPITREQARIGAAKFHETLERWRAWDESDFKIPDPPEGLTNYDDP